MKNPVQPSQQIKLHFAGRVVAKALTLFLLFNLLFAALNPLPALGRISVYNSLLPGRLRLPYGDQPDLAYNLSLFQLDAMFASHELAGRPKTAGEYRVIFVGDSATWGYLLPANEMVTAQINAAGYRLADGRRLQAYNLGYPVMSLTKDLLILSEIMRFDPDLIVWPVTLESFPRDKQLFSPLLQQNPQPVRALIQRHHLALDPQDPQFEDPSFWGRTLLGQRRTVADLVRLQLYAFMWAATGIDQYIPKEYTPRMEDLPAGEDFHELQPPHLNPQDLALDVLEAGMEQTGDVPLLLVNEPMFISGGENSDVRYNFYYPRWAYDDYRRILAEVSQAKGWVYRDMWDHIPPQEFTNSAIHLSAPGTGLYARQLASAILETASGTFSSGVAR